MIADFADLKKRLLRFYDRMVDFIYPPQCVICEKLHENERFFICTHCEKALNELSLPFCLTCRNVLDPGETSCQLCSSKSIIARTWAVGSFDDFFRPLIHAFKYSGILPVGYFLADKLAKKLQGEASESKFDLIVPIPLHPTRLRKRGFDQSHLIARVLSKNLQIEMIPDLLVRIRKTKDQTRLKRQERIENMRGAFAVGDCRDFHGRRVLLIDDVTTTGATACEAARVLKQAGTEEIILGVIAAASQESET